MNILLIAEEAAGMRLVKELAKTEHRIVGVLASPERGALEGPNVWRLAQTMGLPVWPAQCVKHAEFAKTLARQGIDVILNVHSLYIICKSVLETARLGAFNLHPGPLPQYAGLNAPSWAIYKGEKTHAVTVHKMTPQVDSGAIVYESAFAIDDADTALTVFMKCTKLGIPLMLRLVETLAADPASLPHKRQDPSEHRYGPEVPENGRLHWGRPAEQIVNFIRACDYHPFISPWGHPTTRICGHDIGIVRAYCTGAQANKSPGTITESDADSVAVCSADKIIRVRLVNVDGKVVPSSTVLKPGQLFHDA